MNIVLDIALVTALLPGLLQFLKEKIGLTGGAVEALGLAVGWILIGLIGAIDAGLIVGNAVIIIQIVIGGLVATLSAFGYYRLGKARFGNGA